MIRVEQFKFNPFGENTYFLIDNSSRECVIIDCGALGDDEEKEIETFVTEHKLNPIRLIATHGHFDHNFGISFVYSKYGLPLGINQRDYDLLMTMPSQAEKLAGIHLEQERLNVKTFDDNYSFIIGETTFSVIPTPGHTKGSVCFYSESANMLFSGDTLFRGTIGRTDLPYGSMFQMTNSLRHLCQLPDETIIYPGHGPATTMAIELSTNPFLDR